MVHAHCPTCYARISGLVHLCRTEPVKPAPKAKAPRSGTDRATYLQQVMAPHGSRKRFEKGCTCEACVIDGRAEHNAYMRAWKAKRKAAA